MANLTIVCSGAKVWNSIDDSLKSKSHSSFRIAYLELH